MKNIGLCVFAFDITKGMKSYGSLYLLKKQPKTKELIFHTIDSAKKKIKYKDLSVIVGFESEKIKKRLIEEKLTNNAHIIYNEKYKEKNYSYAFKLYLKTILDNSQNLDGVLFLNGNLLIRSIPNYPTKKSWVLVNKESVIPKNNLSCSLNNKQLNFIFYNLSNHIWKEIMYITIQDLNTIAQRIDLYHDNMFMFEIINIANEKQKVSFDTIFCSSKKDIVKINSVKDKKKIS